MSWFISLFQNNPITATAVTFLFVSSAVGAMPSPTFTSGGFYRWLFDFLHAFTGGIFRIIATRNPNFQATSGAQPFRPENADSVPATKIKAAMIQENEAKKENSVIWNDPKGDK